MVSLLNPLYILVLSLIPSFEGRYALVVGVLNGLDPMYSFSIASLGVLILSISLPNLLPYIDVLVGNISKRGSRVLGVLANTYLKYVERVRSKSRRYVEKYGLIGLVIFVALPLPGSGVWTGALAAYLLGFYRRIAILALLIGGLTSNLITLLPIIAYNILG